MEDCIDLRAALVNGLSSRPDTQGGIRTLARIEQSALTDPNGYGLAGSVLRLADPSTGIPLLRRLLDHSNPLTAVEAAAALATLGDRSGLAVLRRAGADRGALTNSQIEFFYVRAALLLLGEPVPPELEARRSVFPDLEEMIDACLRRRPA